MERRNPALKEGGAGGSAWSFPESRCCPTTIIPALPIHAIIPPNLTGPKTIAIAPIPGRYIIPGRGLCRRDFYGIAETAG